MPNYVTIKEAADRAGKAEITIRRFVQSVIREQARSGDRKLIRPSPGDVKRLKKNRQPFSWKIAEELVWKQFSREMPVAPEEKQKTEEPAFRGDVLLTLQSELQGKNDQMKVKDDQIRSLTEIVHSLNERMREGNVLMASLQKHLALPEGKPLETERKEPEKRSWIGRLFS